MLIAMVSAPFISFTCNAASIACLSRGLMMAGMLSRTSVPVFGSIFTSTVPGTCLIHTNTIIVYSPHESFQVLYDVLGDDHAHDLRRALVNLGNLCIAEKSLDGIILDIPVTAEYLDGFRRSAHRR